MIYYLVIFIIFFGKNVIQNKISPLFLLFLHRPSDAETTTLPIQQGDVIVMATDGLFDNVFQDQIVDRLQNINKEVRPS